MGRLQERLIALAGDERRTLAAAREAGPAAGARRPAAGGARAAGQHAGVFGAAESAVLDGADPVLRGWLGGRRDALLALLRDDRAALYDQLALARRASGAA